MHQKHLFSLLGKILSQLEVVVAHIVIAIIAIPIVVHVDIMLIIVVILNMNATRQFVMN